MAQRRRRKTALMRMRPAGARQSALRRMLPLVYDDLRQLAGGYIRRARRGHTLRPTGLVHETYLRLADQRKEWENREHFIAVAARLLRRVFLDYERRWRSARRGGGRRRGDVEPAVGSAETARDNRLDLRAALAELARQHPRPARVVSLRYFGGWSVQEVARELGVSWRTVQGDWRKARIWLRRKFAETGGSGNRLRPNRSP